MLLLSRKTCFTEIASDCAADKPKGGMLALDMGLGKTLCVIAMHALDQHLVPEHAERMTDHTDDALEQSQVVLVGQRYPEDRERENLKETAMYTGFKQLEDGRGTIVPDGSVRRLVPHLFQRCLHAAAELFCSCAGVSQTHAPGVP